MATMNVLEIWRYPVKSMLGEPLESADVDVNGIEGDRRWAVVDAETGVSLSAKRYANLLQCQARTENGAVKVALPDGREFDAGTAELAESLSELLGRRVATRAADAVSTIKHEFPEAVTEGEGDPFLWEPGTAAFFDLSPLHLITTATLDQLNQLRADSEFHRARFRPNFLVEADETGFVENAWVNRDIRIGQVICRVFDLTKRCVMVARGQDSLPVDTRVIRTILEESGGTAAFRCRCWRQETYSVAQESSSSSHDR